MRFRNTRTGAIIEVSSRISGPWEPVDGGNTAQVLPESETAEETEAEAKPKARKRTKK